MYGTLPRILLKRLFFFDSLDTIIGDSKPLISFPDDFLLSGGETRLVICLFVFVPVCHNVRTLFHSNLTCDVRYDYILNFLNVQTSCQELAAKNWNDDGAIQAACLSFPLRSHWNGEESLLCYPFLCSNQP